MLNTDLMASCWTSAGNAGPGMGDELSPHDLRTRIETVARTGWQGFGFIHADILKCLEAGGLQDVAKMLADNGINTVELEMLGDWWTNGPARAESDRIRHALLEAAPILGAGNIKIGADLTGSPVDRDIYLKEFDRLAAEGREAGVRIALEPMPMANINTLEAGVEFVQEVGNSNGGLCVDIWYVTRGGTSYEDLPRLLTPDNTFVVELDDAATDVVGSLWEDTVDQRRLCGEGDWDVPAFIAAMARSGYKGIWGVEILSQAHRSLPIEEGLTRARETAQAVLRQAERLLA